VWWSNHFLAGSGTLVNNPLSPVSWGSGAGPFCPVTRMTPTSGGRRLAPAPRRQLPVRDLGEIAARDVTRVRFQGRHCDYRRSWCEESGTRSTIERRRKDPWSEKAPEFNFDRLVIGAMSVSDTAAWLSVEKVQALALM
jgi:hypothetical protein